LAIWGDFDGICLVPSIKGLLQSIKPGQARASNFFTKLGDDSQVLCVLVSPLPYNAKTKSTTFFMGYASGKVQAVKAVQEEERYSYEIISTVSAHTDEVTTLTVLPLNPPCIASSSVDGTVLVYPESMSSNPSLENAILACRTTTKILCFAATRTEDANTTLLCTSDERGHLTLWSLAQVSHDFRDLSYKTMSSELVEPGGSLPTQMEFLHQSNDIVVVGTNSGGLFTFRLSISRERLLIPLHAVPTAHVGAVESIKIVGNVLLTCGGYEGQVMGWDVNTLSPLGSIAVHPGRLYPPSHTSRSQALLNCAVVDTIVWQERESLVSLCRDGTVQEYSYAASKREEGPPSAASGVNEKALQKEPKTIAALQFVMSNSDSIMCGRMQRSIIQAGLQNKNAPRLSFTGADGIVYEDSKAAFNLFSGLLPCGICKENSIQVNRLCTFYL
jgi:WD40 repeat protein